MLIDSTTIDLILILLFDLLIITLSSRFEVLIVLIVLIYLLGFVCGVVIMGGEEKRGFFCFD